jgi:preprotein translocase subunit SecB
MKLSPLQLENYFVIESHVTASRDYNASVPSDVQATQIVVDRDIKPTDVKNQWEVSLRVQFTPGPGVNTPYFFTLELVGIFRVDDGYFPDRVDRLVNTNGPTILFGIAREVIRNLTGHGPHAPMLLPTASFVPDPIPTSEDVVAVPTQQDAQPTQEGDGRPVVSSCEGSPTG